MWFTKTSTPVETTIRIEVSLGSGQQKSVRHEGTQQPRVVIPTDLMFAAFRQLFPAERMIVCGGYRTKRGVRITSVLDVTEPKPSAVHVRTCPQKLGQALVDFERAGSHLALWLHSHPGEGALATHPSPIDLNQERQLREHYSDQLLCAIAVRDGYLRFWGETTKPETSALQLRGGGIEQSKDDANVYKIQIS